MREIRHSIRRFLRDESGPTAIEYSFMLSLIVFAALTGITIVGETTLGLFNQTKDTMP